jgi:pteridine reductase
MATSNFNNQEQAPIVLITGGAKRIGAAIARDFHRNGYDIIIHYHRSASEAETLSGELNESRPQSATVLQAPLDDIAKVEALAKGALAWKGRLNVLINNASSFYPTPFGQTSEQQWDALLASNVKGAYFLTQALAPALKESNGCVINIADIYADSGLPDHSPYVIAKAGVKMMTKTLARELAPNVRVNGISPGAILWPDTSLADDDQKLRQERILHSIPLARLGVSDDIANTALFLAAQATYLTGQTIRVDGGRNLGISL